MFLSQRTFLQSLYCEMNYTGYVGKVVLKDNILWNGIKINFDVEKNNKSDEFEKIKYQIESPEN